MTLAQPRKIVLTGGPCSGKTTLADVISHVFSKDVVVVPEAASLLFSGGFPRWREAGARRATQGAIFHVQSNLEAAYSVEFPGKILVLDRGTVDGAAYWPLGMNGFFSAMGTSLTNELARYQRVLYLGRASEEVYLINRRKNPNRTETWEEAKLLDQTNFALWEQHPHLTLIHDQRSFGEKISEVLSLIESEIARSAHNAR